MLRETTFFRPGFQSITSIDAREMLSSTDDYAARATWRFIPDFSDKLSAIFIYAENVLWLAEEKTESRKDKLISKILPFKEIIGKKSISKKIEQIGINILDISSATHPIQKSYISIFNSLREIFDEYIRFLNKNPPKFTQPASIENRILQSLQDEETINNKYFRDRILTRILLLPLHFEEINRMINPERGVPPDPLIRKTRAMIGGERSNYGEYRLHNDILDFLSNHRPKIENGENLFPSIAALFTKHSDNFESILNNYKENILHTRASPGGSEIKYGANLQIDGIRRKIYFWKKISKKFEDELKYHISKK